MKHAKYYNGLSFFNGTRLSWIVVLSVCAALNGCATFRGKAYELAQQDDENFSKPLRAPKVMDASPEDVLEHRKGANINSELKIVKPPRLSVAEARFEAEKKVVPKLGESLIPKQSYNSLPVPSFINEVFGNQLGLDFIIQPAMRQVPDLITLRLSSPMTQEDFYVLVTDMLASYGITTFEKDGVLVFDYSADAAGEETPIIMSGRALPEVPSGNRPIFQIYPLTSLKTPNVRGLLSQMFNKNDLTVKEDIYRNALLLSGKSSKVKEAVSAIKLLDRPSMSGMSSVILQPALNTAKQLSDNLTAILGAEGFEVSGGNSPTRLLALESTGQVIVFAKDKDTLDYIVQWAEKLETKSESEVEDGMFTYQVQSTKASHIVTLLSQLGVTSGYQPPEGSGEGASNRSTTNSNIASSVSQPDSKGRYAVDEILNTILFRGSGKDWSQALKLIKSLDKPAPLVMVEVILAEVSLDESEESTIEWLFNSSLFGYSATGSTIGALGQSGAGFNFTLRSGDQTRAAMNFLYDNSRSTIRSRPRVMVKSGESASIDIGDRVPTITSNVQSTATSDSQIIQSVSYQETGVLLDVTPTVHATGFVDLEISQELSEAVNTDSSSIDSPTISTRSINTVLTLRDGGSVLIGGLIRSNDSEGEVGIPVLGKIPLLGKLFRGDNMEQNRTELMIMIIPYILNSPDETEALSDELQRARIKYISD